MSSSPRQLWPVAGVTALLVGAAAGSLVFRPHPSAGAADRVAVGGGDMVAVENSGPEAAALQAAWDRTVDRIRAKDEAAIALIRGEYTLQQAADRFRDLNADDPNALRTLRWTYAGAPDDELVFRQVLQFAAALAERVLGRDRGRDRVRELGAAVDARFPKRAAHESGR